MHKSALVIPHIINSREYFTFKVGTIQWINDRLDNISVGTGDATIGSILLLINFEVSAVFPVSYLGKNIWCLTLCWWAFEKHLSKANIPLKLMRGNVVEARYHMDGVQQIINLRGGLGNVNNRNVLTRILV
jgi:hypothetical protein